MAQQEPITSNFNLSTYVDLIHEVCDLTNDYMNEYNCRFEESFRSNPFARFEEYLDHTVKYGNYNNTKNRLLFGGEVDYVTCSIYDILAHLAIWRLFNVLNTVELNKVKANNPDSNIILDRNFGTKIILKLRRKGASFDREFDTISNIKIFKEPIQYLTAFYNLDIAIQLYDRFRLFGIFDWFSSINNLDKYSSELVDEQLSKKQIGIVNIADFADDHCDMLDSIKSYCLLKSKYELSGLNQYYLDNLFNQDLQHVRRFAVNKLKDTMAFAYSIQYPVLYNLKK